MRCKEFRRQSGVTVGRTLTAIPDSADHHNDDDRGNPGQRDDHHGLFHEFDRPGLEIVGEATRIGALSKRIDGGRQLLAGDVDVLPDGLGIPIRHVFLQVRLMHLTHYPRPRKEPT